MCIIYIYINKCKYKYKYTLIYIYIYVIIYLCLDNLNSVAGECSIALSQTIGQSLQCSLIMAQKQKSTRRKEQKASKNTSCPRAARPVSLPLGNLPNKAYHIMQNHGLESRSSNKMWMQPTFGGPIIADSYSRSRIHKPPLVHQCFLKQLVATDLHLEPIFPKNWSKHLVLSASRLL